MRDIKTFNRFPPRLYTTAGPEKYPIQQPRRGTTASSDGIGRAMEILPRRQSHNREDASHVTAVTSLTPAPLDSFGKTVHDLDITAHGDTATNRTRDPVDAGERAANANQIVKGEVESDMRRTRTLVTSAPAAADTKEQYDDGQARIQPAILSRRSQTSQTPVTKSKSPTESNHHTPPTLHPSTFPPDKPGVLVKRSFETADGEPHPKEKKKGVSFLSRFIGNKKKGASDSEAENEDEETDTRPEGMEAQLFSQQADVEGIAYHPKYPQPPPYIKFRSKYKKEKEFDRVFLAQELQAGRPRPPRRRTANSVTGPALQETPLRSDENAIWALEFSKDGRFLAAGGQDKVVRVWAVLSTPEERRTHEKEEDEEVNATRHLRLEAPVFQKLAIREYEGHEGPVIDLSWSKNNFLLSASADKTVRLWHTSRAECLCTFKHTEHVHSVQFHPRDDRFFLAGSRDMKLRFWSIPDKSVAFWQQLSEVITAVSFTPDGKTAIAGTINGVCNFYETEGLKYQTQIHVRSAYGKNAKGSKICSIQTVNLSDKDKGDVKMLISSNDARVRLYNFRDKSLEVKFKGHKSEERTIKAQISDDGEYIITGSEDKGAYIWSTGPSESEKPTQRPVEFFEATTSQTTCAILAPVKTRQLLSQSQDPIYDLCNPPPVTLLSRSESAASSRAPTEPNSATGTPRTDNSPRKMASESPAYIARSEHPGGQLIVTASSTGVIRVYRQDCAFQKRKSNEDSASLFNGKRPSSIYMARAMSRSSAGGRGSRSDSTGTQPPQDRILDWRERVGSTHSLDRNGVRQNSDAKSTRSNSPSKSGLSFRKSGSIRRSAMNGKLDGAADVGTLQPLTMGKGNVPTSPTSTVTPTQASSAPFMPRPDEESNPLWLENGQSFMSWDTKEYASMALRPKGGADGLLHAPGARPGLTAQESKLSVISKLSSEEMSDTAEGEEGRRGEGERRCGKCGSGVFKPGLVEGKGHWLVCQRCGTLAQEG